MIKHLEAHDIRASRDEKFAKISVLVAMSRLSLEERVDWVVERFRRNLKSRPTRKKSLLTSIHAFCRKELSATEVDQIANALVAKRLIRLTPQGEVTFEF